MATDDPVAVSRRLVEAVRRGEPTDDLEATLAGFDPTDLAEALDGGAARTAFWLNVYNAFVQVGLARAPDSYDSKRRFFGAPRVAVAGRELSLDDVEHGMLRRSRWKWGLGYLPRPFPGEFERRLRVPERDHRVHFALNCGAVSCPAVASYDPGRLDEDLDAAAATYLDGEAEYDPGRNVATVPRQCLWYRGDFGGGPGIRAMLRRYDVVPDGTVPRLRYRDYDWRPDPGDFRD